METLSRKFGKKKTDNYRKSSEDSEYIVSIPPNILTPILSKFLSLDTRRSKGALHELHDLHFNLPLGATNSKTWLARADVVVHGSLTKHD